MAEEIMESGTSTLQDVNSTNLEQALKLKRDSIIEQMRALDSSIAELQAEFSSKIEELHSNKKTYEEMLNHIQAILKMETKSNETQHITDVNSNDDISITDSAFNLLQESHKPMHYKDIANALNSRGLHISGVNPAATLLSRISRDGRFKRVKRGTYGLKGWRRPKDRKRRSRKRN
jgi:DNA-directed RNA polymerase delta subunit